MKTFDYTALTDNFNNDLCVLESETLMLLIANKQYRKAIEKRLPDNVVDYFSRKISAYSTSRELMMSDIENDLHILKAQIFKSYESNKQILWNEFKKAFPNSTLKFEDVFVNNTANYEKVKGSIENGDNNSDLDNAFLNYAQTYIEATQLKNFENLLYDIYEQINSQGALPFMGQGLNQNNVVVPSQLIITIDEKADKEYGDLRKEAINIGVNYQKSKKNKNSEGYYDSSRKRAEDCLDKLEDLKVKIDKLGFMSETLNHIYQRISASTKKWKLGEVRGLMYEKLMESGLSIPKDIKKIKVDNKPIIVCKDEVERIVYTCLQYDNLLADGLLLSSFAEISPIMELCDYEQSKQIVETLSKNQQQFEAELQKLTKLPNENGERISELKKYISAMSNLQIETPFGKVCYKNNKLVNLQNGETYDINVLYNFVLKDGEFTKLNESNKKLN